MKKVPASFPAWSEKATAVPTLSSELNSAGLRSIRDGRLRTSGVKTGTAVTPQHAGPRLACVMGTTLGLNANVVRVAARVAIVMLTPQIDQEKWVWVHHRR